MFDFSKQVLLLNFDFCNKLNRLKLIVKLIKVCFDTIELFIAPSSATPFVYENLIIVTDLDVWIIFHQENNEALRNLILWSANIEQKIQN